MSKPKQTEDIRQENKLNILRLLFLKGSMSRRELSQISGLSPGTVTNVTSELLEQQIIRQSGLIDFSGGRPREILAINPSYGYILGIDVGETQIQFELFDLLWNKIGSLRSPSSENIQTHFVDLISEGVQNLVAKSSVDADAILGIGIGVPGVVEHKGKIRVSSPLWNWHEMDFLTELEKRINLPVYVDNGAKAMTLAESWFGAGRGVRDLAVILIGTGIGAGIITKGELYHGSTNSAGEWGHTKVVLDGRDCRCGSQGCVEAYAGAPGIIRTYYEISNQQPNTGKTQYDEIIQILTAYKNNDPFAIQTIQKTAYYLGAGLANLVNLFNPEKIIIGGWVGLMVGKIILENLTRYIKRYSLPASLTHLEIGLCQLGEDAVCIGASCLVLNEILEGNPKFGRRSPYNAPLKNNQ